MLLFSSSSRCTLKQYNRIFFLKNVCWNNMKKNSVTLSQFACTNRNVLDVALKHPWSLSALERDVAPW